MKQFILGITMALLCGLHVQAQEPSDFNPNNPPEPSTVYALSISYDTAQTESVTGDGGYHAGDGIWLTATPNNQYAFTAWMEGDSVLSNESSFHYIMPGRNVHLTARFEYRLRYPLTLVTNPTGIGSFSGNGYYEIGEYVGVSTSAVTNYSFKGWWENNSLVNANNTFQYVMPDRPVLLTAKYEYEPSNPSEPTIPILVHRVELISNPVTAGYFSPDPRFSMQEGVSTTIYAYQNTNFVFDGWFHADTLYTRSSTFNYTMGKADVTLTARFHYDPSSPADPNPGENALYHLSAITQTAAPGTNLAYPVYLLNENIEVYSAVFNMTFPAGVLVDYQNVSLSSRRNGHTLTCDTLGNNSYRFTISNEQALPLLGTSGSLLIIPVIMPMSWDPGTSFPVVFNEAFIGISGGQLECPFKNGAIGVTATTTELYASFYSDTHLNRMLFINMSSTNATTFHWDFGDGQTSTEKNPLHVYAASGSYDVVLKVSDGIYTDSIRVKIDIANEALWRMEGFYTLNKQKHNVKNFPTSWDLFNTLSRCNISGDLFIQVEPGQIFESPLTDSLNAVFSRINQRIKLDLGHIMTFNCSAPDSIPLLNFSGTLNQDYIENVLDVALNFRFDKVETAFSGLKVNVNQLHEWNELTICSGKSTPVIDLSLLGNQFDTRWDLIRTSSHLTGQMVSGTNVIPSMTLINDTTIRTDLVYAFQLISDGYVFYDQSILYNVNASLKVAPKTIGPATNALLENTNVTFRWASQDNVLYDVFLWEVGFPMPATPLVSGIWSSTYSDNTHCKNGTMYYWKVLARSTCDSIWSAVDSFQIDRYPDLMVESITLSKTEIFAGEGVDVRVRIRNMGGKAYGNSWGDQLYLVSGDNQVNRLSMTTRSSWRILESDSSYVFDYKATLPLDTVRYTHFLFEADTWHQLTEINETNNSKLSDSLSLKYNYISDSDFAALKYFYDHTAGSGWTRRWNFSTKVVVGNNWPGVTFQNGNIVAIDLNNNKVNGPVQAAPFQLPYLQTLLLNGNKLSGSLEGVAEWMKTNNYRGDSLTQLNLANNLLTGEVSAFAYRFPKLSWLSLESNKVTRMDTVLSKKISSLNLQYQVFSHPDMPLVMTPPFNPPTLFWYKFETSELPRSDAAFYLMKNSSHLGRFNFQNGRFVLSLYNDWNYASGDSFDLMQYNSYVYGSKTRVRLSYSMGDANIDQQTNVLDVQHTLNRILLEYPYPFNRIAANTYVDDKITVQDIVSTVNILLETGVVVDTIQQAALRSATIGNVLYVNNGSLMMHVEIPVSAMDLSLRGVSDKQLRLLLNSNDFQMVARNTAEGVRFIVFSSSGKEIPIGLNNLAAFSSEKAQIVGALMANRQAEAVPVLIAESPTDLPNGAESTIQAYLEERRVTLLLSRPFEQVTVQVYSMQGLLINQRELNQVSIGKHTMDYNRTLPSGVYILKLVFRNGDSVQTKNYKWMVSK